MNNNDIVRVQRSFDRAKRIMEIAIPKIIFARICQAAATMPWIDLVFAVEVNAPWFVIEISFYSFENPKTIKEKVFLEDAARSLCENISNEIECGVKISPWIYFIANSKYEYIIQSANEGGEICIYNKMQKNN